MALPTDRALGILDIERGLPYGTPPPPPRFSAVFDFAVLTETVESAWADKVILGDAALEAAYVGAARRLVERGAIAITSNCGFSIRYQAAVAASVNIPVALSSLLLLPTLLRQLPSIAKIAILTVDSKFLGDELLGIEDRAERARIVIGGVEGGEFWRNATKRPPQLTAVAAIEADVTARVTQLRAEHPEIRALLLECTAFPLVAPAIRSTTKLPTYDITSLIKMVFAAAR